MWNKINSGWRILKSEFANQFTSVKMLSILFAIGVPLLAVFTNEDFDTQFKNDWKWKEKKESLNHKEYNDLIYITKIILSSNLVPIVLVQGTIFALFARIFSIIRDNSTLDKNRVSFITHNKNVVVFTKLFIDFLLFAINIGLLCVITPLSITLFLGGTFSNKTYLVIVKFFVSILFVYIFISFGIRFLNASIINNKKRIILIGLWGLISAGFYVVGSSMTENKYFYAFVVTNIDLIKYIPFLNLMIPHLYLIQAGNLEWIDLLPMGLTSLVIIQIPWFIYSKKTKEFLCG